MSREQEREFELVFGNKQLAGVLIIVAVLLAVFFSVGYVMGRNNAPVEVAGSVPAEDASTAVEGRPSQVPPPSEVTLPEAEPTPTLVEMPAASALREPQPGQTFWQVSAVAKPEAELLVDVLGRKGFQALVAPGPNEKLYRVLVGPARDQSELARLRTDLEQAGFKPMIRKY